MARPATELLSAPDAWTPALVQRKLIKAFGLMPTVGIFSRRKGMLRVGVVAEQRIGPLDFLGHVEQYLPREGQVRVHLLAWARAQAGVGNSMSKTCRDFGWDRSVVYANRDRGSRLIAAGLNRDGVPLFVMPQPKG